MNPEKMTTEILEEAGERRHEKVDIASWEEHRGRK
jgi:hypothetical protein